MQRAMGAGGESQTILSSGKREGEVWQVNNGPRRCLCPNPQDLPLCHPPWPNRLADAMKLKTSRWADSPGFTGQTQ